MELGINRTREATPVLEEIGYRVDDLIVDVHRQHVARGSEKINLSPLSYELLLTLLRAAPDVVSLDQLMRRVWPGLVVSPETVSQRVKLVRQALGDKAASPRYIAGVRGRGYRLIARVEEMDAPGAPTAAAPGANGHALLATRAAAARAAEAGTATDIPAAPAQTVVSPSPLRGWLRRILFTLGLLALAAMALRPAAETLRSWYATRSPDPAAEVAGNSLAVLPFVNLSGDQDSEYFSDGLSEEILNRLSRADGLRVLARTSSFAWKGGGMDVRRLREVLGVRYVLEGSVRRENSHLRVTARLVDGSGFRIWSASYEREVTGIFEIQDEIAASVVTSILPQVVVVPTAETRAHPDVEAYEHYLIGRELLRGRVQKSRAEQELEQAIDIDPDFAEARAELAIALIVGADEAETVDALERAEQQIDAALSLEPQLARAHAARGLLLLSRHVVDMQPLEVPRIEAALRTALMLDPRMVDAYNWLGNALAEQGRYDDAREQWARGARIAPLAPAVNVNLAADYALRGDVPEAERRLQRLVELPRASIGAWLALEELYFTTGRLLRSHAIASQLAGEHPDHVSGRLLVASHARLGMWGNAGYWLQRLEQDGSDAARRARPELFRLQGRYGESATLLEALLASRDAGAAPASLVLELGTLHALAGDYRAAIRILAPATLSDFTPSGPGIDGGQGLAWAYLQSGAPGRAGPLLAGFERFFAALRIANRLHGSEMLYLFAQNAVLAGRPGVAVGRLRQAVAAGWRDYYRLRHDPRWQSLRDDRRFREILAAVEADVERQRNLVLRATASTPRAPG